MSFAVCWLAAPTASLATIFLVKDTETRQWNIPRVNHTQTIWSMVLYITVPQKKIGQQSKPALLNYQINCLNSCILTQQSIHSFDVPFQCCPYQGCPTNLHSVPRSTNRAQTVIYITKMTKPTTMHARTDSKLIDVMQMKRSVSSRLLLEEMAPLAAFLGPVGYKIWQSIAKLEFGQSDSPEQLVSSSQRSLWCSVYT